MGAVFLWVSHAQGGRPFTDQSLVKALSGWVPFLPERSEQIEHPSGLASALVWQTHGEGARGSFTARSPTSHLALSYTGWWREPDAAPLDAPSSGVMLAALCGGRSERRARYGYERGLADFSPRGGWSASAPLGEVQREALDMLHLSPGQFAVSLADQAGRVHGVKSALGGASLYYSSAGRDPEGAPLALISNRASLISAFLNRGAPSRPRPESLAWLLARHEQPLDAHQEPWAEVKALMSGERVSAYAGELTLHQVTLPSPATHDWDRLFEGLCWRTEQLKRLPDVPYALALTGGYDSRLTLGALKATQLLDRVSRYYINAAPQHSDARVAQALATHLQLALQLEPPGRWQSPNEPLLARIRRHNFYVEYLFSAWDLLGGPPERTLAQEGLIPGHLGELYRSHYHPLMSRSRLLLSGLYPSAWYADRHQLLTRQMMRRCGEESRAWVRARYAEGVKTDFIFDQLHRHARQEGWATRAINVESLGFPSLCLIPCVSTRAHYEASPLSSRRRPEVHFELLRRVDDELWRLPFAEKTWPQALTQPLGFSPPPPVRGSGDTSGYQVRAWRAQGAQLSEWLLDAPPSSPLWELIDRAKLERKLKHVAQQGAQQVRAREVKGLIATCAIKLALTEPLHPLQLRR